MNMKDFDYYFVALIDIVGQRDKLNQLVKLSRNKAEKERIDILLSETSEYVKQLREQFNDFFRAASNPTGMLDTLAPAQREWAEQRKKSIIWRRGFSDSYVITIPCWYEARFGVHIGDICQCLHGLCALSLWSLVKEKPIRGGVDIHLGTVIDTQEVYGPVTARAYKLEAKEAKYPRIVVGEGLLSHLNEMKKLCPDNPDGRHTSINIDKCKEMITTDFDGKYILDFMGEGIKSLPDIQEFLSRMVHDAYRFVVKQEKQFRESGNTKLRVRYSRLRAYCESRLSLWGINPHKD